MNDWYVINTKPHAEFKVISYLASKKIETFMPKFLITRRHARKVDKVFRPLFPSSVPNSIIDELNSITDDNGLVKYLDKSNYSYGQEVRINEGLFRGNIGKFCQMNDKERVLVLISFLGRKLKVSVPSLHIAAI